MKAKKVRSSGLDLIREYHVFETLNEVIHQINNTDMHERSILLRRVEKQCKATVSTWKILTNQATIYGLSKSNKDQSEIEELQQEIEEMKLKKKELIKQRDELNTEHDDKVISFKNEINNLLTQNQKEMQKYQQQHASNSQILQESKNARN